MRRFAILPLFFLSAILGAASAGAVELPLGDLEQLVMPPVDHAALLAEDAARSGPGVPFRFAQALAVRVSPETRGTWERVGDELIWRLRVASPGARSLSFGFSRFVMPIGGALRVLDTDGRPVLRAFTEADNERHGELWTPLVLADEAVLEVRLPAAGRSQLELLLGQVNHGYRDLSEPDKSGACNVDVVCPEGEPWEEQIRSVAMIAVNGVDLCTGFMVNNTSQDFTPYFLTANHCRVTPSSAASLVAYWNYRSSTCRTPGSLASGAPGDGTFDNAQTGAVYRAGGVASDFTLVELDDLPDPSWNVHWAGWDRSNADPEAVVAIHHPNVEEKRISFDDDATSTTSYLCPDPPGASNCPGGNDGTHLRVEDWDLGTTEGGSSGSPLFNPEGRVVGQLHGGYAACSNDLPDWYGRLSVSWDMGLGNYLDPFQTGAMTLDGADPSVVSPCVPSPEVACLDGGRFQVSVDWQTPFFPLAPAFVSQLGTDTSALFYFRNPGNLELLVKVVDGCTNNNHYWVFTAATTNVEYTLTVVDTETNRSQTYQSAFGPPATAVIDTRAFATCP